VLRRCARGSEYAVREDEMEQALRLSDMRIKGAATYVERTLFINGSWPFERRRSQRHSFSCAKRTKGNLVECVLCAPLRVETASLYVDLQMLVASGGLAVMAAAAAAKECPGALAERSALCEQSSSAGWFGLVVRRGRKDGGGEGGAGRKVTKTSWRNACPFPGAASKPKCYAPNAFAEHPRDQCR
jgi:hypothetical protein